MNKLCSLLFLLVAGCGSAKKGEPLIAPSYTTEQGVLVFDETSLTKKSVVEQALRMTKDYAPADFQKKFENLDGYELHLLVARTVAGCQIGEVRAMGCVDYALQHILVANRSCSNYRTSMAILAHEIGHVLIEGGDYGHSNQAWFGFGGVEDRVQATLCGWVPTPNDFPSGDND